jgi:hypothetical protein
MGAVGVTQLVALAQPPHAPLAVHTSAPGQLSGVALHALQVSFTGSQIGASPAQPALFCPGSHTAHFPATHRLLPSVRPAQSVASWHSAHDAGGPAMQNRSSSFPEQATPAPRAHSQRRARQATETISGHASPQASHSSTDVFLHIAS